MDILGELPPIRVHIGNEVKERPGAVVLAVSLVEPVGHILGSITEHPLLMKVRGDAGGCSLGEWNQVVPYHTLLEFELSLVLSIVHMDTAGVLWEGGVLDTDLAPGEVDSSLHGVLHGELHMPKITPPRHTCLDDISTSREDVMEMFLQAVVREAAYEHCLAHGRLGTALWPRVQGIRWVKDNPAKGYRSFWHWVLVGEWWWEVMQRVVWMWQEWAWHVV